MSTPAIMNLFDAEIEDKLRAATHAFPNQHFEREGLTAYYKITYLEAQSEQFAYGNDRVPSILQIDAVVKDKSGNRSDMVQDVLDAFYKGKRLSNSQASIRIDRAPYIGSGFNVDGWYITPISIPYEVFR